MGFALIRKGYITMTHEEQVVISLLSLCIWELLTPSYANGADGFVVIVRSHS